MAVSCLSSGDLSDFSDGIEACFESFKRAVIVYKPVQETLISQTGDYNFAFEGDAQPNLNMSGTVETGVCDAKITYSPKQDKIWEELTTDLPLEIARGLAKVKFKASDLDLVQSSERIIDGIKTLRLVTSLKPQVIGNEVLYYIGYFREIQ